MLFSEAAHVGKHGGLGGGTTRGDGKVRDEKNSKKQFTRLEKPEWQTATNEHSCLLCSQIAGILRLLQVQIHSHSGPECSPSPHTGPHL